MTESCVQSNSCAVKEFTEGSLGVGVPTHPVPFNRTQVVFVIRMVMSELDELANTVSDNEMSKTNLMHEAFYSRDVCTKGYANEVEGAQLIGSQADALVDAWYYMLNAAAKNGMNLSRIFDVVHQANMNKRDPKTGTFIRRETDGKIIKPDGWKEPDIVGEVEHQLKVGSWN